MSLEHASSPEGLLERRGAVYADYVRALVAAINEAGRVPRMQASTKSSA